MPKYLIAFNDEWVPVHTPDELRRKGEASQAVLADMREAGVFLYADGGIDASTAVFSVVSKGGEPVFTDGPFVESKEHLGGFTVIEVADDEAARHWAGRLAVALDWPQEVHRFPSDMGEIIERHAAEASDPAPRES
ncbi:YciI family protein [Microbacterium awajiense]|uniref:YciI family protein n=1 Tax=Microbacterium awajiense TaxID=415214 RepID=A0ABP7AF58_9MICO